MILIDKASLISHIESEAKRWGEEYDCYQILGDIEDFATIEAIPIKWIEERIKQKEQEAMRARNADNFEAMDNLNHTIWELECLLEDWKKRK